MSQLGAAAGTVIAGRYALGARIGTSGMGAVYEGMHIVTRRLCAIKLMLGHTAEREEMRTRFFRESRALAQIKSQGLLEPGTRSVYAFRQDRDTVVGVYLLTPSPPANANVLEKVMYVKK